MNPTQKVNSEVGLIVREKPSSKSAKVGTLENGTLVTVAGAQAAEPGMIEAVSITDAEDATAVWIELAKPIRGWVLYYSVNGEDTHFFITSRDE